MSHALSSREIHALLSALCGNYDAELPGGRIKLLARSLGGKAVSAILPGIGDGVLRIAYDLNKPNAFAHAQAMIRDHWESYAEPVAFPDGTVEMLSRVCPEPEAGPVRVTVHPETG